MVLNGNGVDTYVFPVSGSSGGGDAKPEQEKTVEITTNGQTVITPDSGYALSKVTANVNVTGGTVETQEKMVELTEDNSMSDFNQGQNALLAEIVPDPGKYLSKVYVAAVFTNTFWKFVSGELTAITADDLQYVESIASNTFAYNERLQSVEIPGNVKTIGVGAFKFCDEIHTVSILDGVLTIGTDAFNDCSSLTNLSIGNSVTTISDRAFAYCSSLTSVTVPASVTVINNHSFTCGSPTNKFTITMLPTTPPTMNGYPFTLDALNQIIVPAGCGDAYKAATNWANYAEYIVEATA